MAMGFLALDAFNALEDINDALNERDEIRGLRIQRRMLRDVAHPFELPERTFRSFFRVSRELALDLCGWLRPFLERQKSHGLKVQTQVLTALRFFATGSYQAAVGQDANIAIGQASVSRAVNVVARAISRTLLHEYVKFPTTDGEILAAKLRFATCPQPFQNTVGAIDCTHIAIIAPRVHEETYINHHGYHSINVQLICDPTLKVLAANARYGGRAHDTFIWYSSCIRRQLKQRYEAGQRNTWLIGDSGYPLEPWLLTPITDAERGTPESVYTDTHCSARSIIERCNGALKSSWSCLSKKIVLYYDPVSAGHIIYACIVLHNLRIQYRLHEDDEDFEEDPQGDREGEEGEGGAQGGNDFEESDDDNEGNEEDIEVQENPQLLAEARNIRNAHIEEYYT